MCGQRAVRPRGSHYTNRSRCVYALEAANFPALGDGDTSAPTDESRECRGLSGGPLLYLATITEENLAATQGVQTAARGIVVSG